MADENTEQGQAAGQGQKKWWRRLAWTGTLGLASAIAAVSIIFQDATIKLSEKVGLREPAVKPEGAQPFVVSVITDYFPEQGFAFSAALDDGPHAAGILTGSEVDDPQGLAKLLDDAGGAPRKEVGVQLVVTGMRNTPIRITGIGVNKSARTKVLSGTSIQPSTQGQSSVIPVRVNLDQTRAEVRDKSGAPYFSRHNIDLKRDERATIGMTYTAEHATYRWTLSIDYVDNKGKHTVHIDKSGRQYRTAAEISSGNSFVLTGKARKYKVAYESNNPSPGYHLR
ncbi:hypothetical protein [Actinomadura sp. WMMA1423]|uniref:hypothetical protein n=1 Tax=Actinomadura sp. WMMA1423 TaxID=2591108 RepID=UPI0011476DCC|nr:hypothetical protein [Actinomadura sp. WMMA1423]